LAFSRYSLTQRPNPKYRKVYRWGLFEFLQRGDGQQIENYLDERWEDRLRPFGRDKTIRARQAADNFIQRMEKRGEKQDEQK